MPFSLRSVGCHRPDYHDIQSLIHSPMFKDKTGDALAMAIYDFFTSTVHGTYHFWPMHEKKGTPQLRRGVLDALQGLNNFGWMICGQHANLQLQFYLAGGLGARLFGLPGHSLCCAVYDGDHRHFDIDMWTWFRGKDGKIASPEALASDAKALIVDNKNKSNPCNLPDRSIDGYAGMYASALTPDGPKIKYLPPFPIYAFNADYRLLPGETLEISDMPQGRFHFPDSWKPLLKQHEKEWKGHPRERYEPFRTYGNGRLTYSPELSNRYADIKRGAWTLNGVTQTSDGLAGIGDATFRLQSPYLFCGVPSISEKTVTTKDGATVHLAGVGSLTLKINNPEGGTDTIRSLSGAFDETIDITVFTDGRRDCLLTVSLGKDALLKKLSFSSYIMTAPKSLPYLTVGDNLLELRRNDRFGLTTTPWHEIIDFRKGASPSLIERAVSVKNATIADYVPDWDCLDRANPAKPVQAVYRFDAPAGKPFAWCYAVGSIRESELDRPDATGKLEISIDGKNWKLIDTMPLRYSESIWDVSVQGNYKPDSPVKSIFLRVTADTSITGVEFYGHILEADDSNADVVVRHRWTENGKQKEMAVNASKLPDNGQYVVHCDQQAAGHSIAYIAKSIKR